MPRRPLSLLAAAFGILSVARTGRADGDAPAVLATVRLFRFSFSACPGPATSERLNTQPREQLTLTGIPRLRAAARRCFGIRSVTVKGDDPPPPAPLATPPPTAEVVNVA